VALDRQRVPSHTNLGLLILTLILLLSAIYIIYRRREGANVQ